MKIGIDIRLIGKNRTGDEVVFFNLTKKLARIDTDHRFELFTDETDGDKLAEIGKWLGIDGKENFKIVSLETKNRFSWNFWDLQKYLRKNPVDVYLTQYITPFFVPKNIKIVTIIHDISFNFFPQFIKKSDLLFLKTLIPLSIERADLVLGVSEFTRDEIIKFYKTDPKKVDFFHNAVSEDFKNQDVSEEKLVEVRKKYGLPEKFILYLGTLQPRKNIPFLIESYAKIKDKISDTNLVLVGNRQAHNFDIRIDEAIRKHNLEESVVFPGFVDEQDKAAVYKSAHVFAFPSLYEGFGIPILEAFEMKTPVLAADIPSLREVGEDAASFADPKSIDKFSKALYDISIDENLRDGLVARGRERTGHFCWEKTARKLLAAFENVIRK
ncbi:MAG: Glycosyltransferase [Candidatus Moranbacteria bacterium GW2011_GWC2_45_10]|nr:MAG: Glycosyltransferase [Candidatus Moranbacteria bacterium GW2011_GWC2_45_10]